MMRRRETADTSQSGLIPRMIPYNCTLTERYLRVRIQNIILDGQTETNKPNRYGSL